MNMLLNFARNAIAAAASIQVQPQAQYRTEMLPAYDSKGNHIGYEAHPVQNYRHLKSRGTGSTTSK